MIKQPDIENLTEEEHINFLEKLFRELNLNQEETQFYKNRKLKGKSVGLDKKGKLVYQSELNTKASADEVL